MNIGYGGLEYCNFFYSILWLENGWSRKNEKRDAIYSILS